MAKGESFFRGWRGIRVWRGIRGWRGVWEFGV